MKTHEEVISINDESLYKKVKESTFMKMSKLMNEVSYKEYKKDESLNSRQKVNKSIKEVATKLFKIERNPRNILANVIILGN